MTETIHMPEQPDGNMLRAAIAVRPKISHYTLMKVYRAMRDARPVSMGGRGGAIISTAGELRQCTEDRRSIEKLRGYQK